MRFWSPQHCIFALVAVLRLSGCVPTLRTSGIDVRATIDRAESERAYTAIALALLDKGFDFKIKDTAMRLLTTEYKKIDSVSGWPPFDFYLQVKVVVRDVPGNSGGEIVLWPKMKEQNRLNQNAFTEHPLIVYSPVDPSTSTFTARSEAMHKGQLIFRSVLQAITDALGSSVRSFRYTTAEIEVIGM